MGSLKRRRLEALEASQGVRHEIPMSLQLYFKALENYHREQAGNPLIPLTEEEKRYEREMNNDHEFQAYWKQLDHQQMEQLLREERS